MEHETGTVDWLLELLWLRPELTLAVVFVALFVIWWGMGRKLDKAPASKVHSDEETPQVTLPGGIHDGWFDGLQNRLNDFGAADSPFAKNFETIRKPLLGGTAEKSIAAMDVVSKEDAATGRALRTESDQHLLGAAIASIAAGDLELALQNMEVAVQHFSLAIEMIPFGHDALMAESLNKFGIAQYRSGQIENFDKAVISLRRALKLTERTSGPNHPDVASVLNNLAMLYFEKGDAGTARPLYERALKIDEAASGKDSLAVATDLNNLGLLLKHQDLLEEAEPVLNRALSIKEMLYEPGHPSLVTGLRNYATLLRAMGREEEAEALDLRIS